MEESQPCYANCALAEITNIVVLAALILTEQCKKLGRVKTVCGKVLAHF